MTRLTVDFSQVEDFEAFAAGRYPVVIESVEVREPKEQGKYPYLNFTLVVADGEFEGRKLWFVGSLAPKALFRLKALFDSFGFEGEQAELDYDPGSGILLTPSFAGLPAMADVSVEMYNKKERNRVEELVSGDGLAAPVKAKKAGDALVKKAAKPVAKVEEPVDDAQDEDPNEDPQEDEASEAQVEEAVEEEVKEVPKVSTKPNPFAPKTGTAPRKVFK